MLADAEIRELLAPFVISLSTVELSKLKTYLELLLGWNRRINLSAVRAPSEIVTRHFGESFFVARSQRLAGRLLDVGSGAGFPGLALKIPFPDVAATLLEPAAKKRAFLKEVSRACRFEGVEVRAERLEEFARLRTPVRFDSVTARAVGRTEQLIPLASKCLETDGRIFLWLGRKDAEGISATSLAFHWDAPIQIPLSRERVILSGKVAIGRDHHAFTLSY